MQEQIIITIIQYTVLICFSIIGIPGIVYRVFSKEKIGFLKWIGLYDISLMELFFITICLFLVLFFNNFSRILPLILMLYALIIFKYQMTSNKIKIKNEKKFLYAFIIIIFVYMGINLYYNYINLLDTINTINQYRLVQLPLTMTIFLGYLLRVRLKDFNWSITFRALFVVVLVYILYLTYFLFYDMKSLMQSTPTYFIKNFVQQIYYPSIVEEVIFRGYLLSGLLAFGVREDKSNIIQAIVFGVIHVLGFKEISIISFLVISFQVFLGYLFGKIYLSTKSLTPCIILHALIDTLK
ncbi:CAAX prenyl protease-like protein [Marinisporobacter balticus]|uniref:CAAX prenyl protease-like protein n=2 Tax=Marinisporobacter balticus TaxID=2018667 RepID=A0A4R2KKX3_9FIRM|nr:CAAX prenyl protease-like protein [Marinisporobacter balticus]